MNATIDLAGMLLIGSAGRNSGKTVLACRLLERWGRRIPIVAIKVTTIRGEEGSCPRGGEGCGVCSSLEGEFQIRREEETGLAKDTSRLLAAGADRVYWLCVREESLAAGMAALRERIGMLFQGGALLDSMTVFDNVALPLR